MNSNIYQIKLPWVGTNEFEHESWNDCELFNNIEHFNFDKKLTRYSNRFNSVELDISFQAGSKKSKYTIDNIKAQARDNGFTDFHFSFSGGEPTAYKYFGEVIDHYCSDTAPKYQSIHMTTNLSPGSKWWNRWLESTSTLQRRSITASYHAEFANEQEFGDKCLQLMKGGTFVTINQVMVPEMFEELYGRLERFAARGINVTLKPQSDPTASYVVHGYTEGQITRMQTGFPQRIPEEFEQLIPILGVELIDKKGNKHLLDQAERFNAFGFNKFKGWECNAGYQGCVIRENEVKRSYSCKINP